MERLVQAKYHLEKWQLTFSFKIVSSVIMTIIKYWVQAFV